MMTLSLDDLTVPAPPAGYADWNEQGVVVLPSFVGGTLLDSYRTEWVREAPAVTGWPHATPYMERDALRRLCCHGPLGRVLESLIGEPAGVHLNLTGWVTTQRDWHQDSYLNPPHVGDAYAAVWVALDDIHPDSGPFQYVPGSHRWPQVTRDLIGGHLDITDPRWPARSEEILSPLFEREIAARDGQVITYLPSRGDVLIWHGRLLHRGSKAHVEGMIRPALIAHFSGVHHRQDMAPAVRHTGGGWYFPITGAQPVR